jgi:hypothetical protein
MSRLREYRERYGLTQEEAVAAIQRHALARGDKVMPGLDQCGISRHENGHKRPGPYYQQLYCEVYGATPVELGFRLALPGETRNHEDVDRREFLAGAAGLVATAALPSVPVCRVGNADVVHLRQSMVELYRMGHQHGGAGAVYPLAVRTFHRLRGFVERASYSPATGQALQELVGQAAGRAGETAFDAGEHDDARRWWLEALHWYRLSDSGSLAAITMAAMAVQASDHRRPREVIALATDARRAAGAAATPRLTSLLLAREALGHAGAGDATRARASLRRARGLVETRHDDDPYWLQWYAEADFTSNERHVALMLSDTVAAEESARAGLALGDPVEYPRNHALYMVGLADVLAQQRKIDESAAVASQAAAAAAELDSRRVARRLHAVARRLAPYRSEPAVGAFLAAV